ncbi:hypothetical protein [Phycisphaera mikurensis]|uniref:Uncharacterized protein n=1 Tax=Phycisphaera mikurensis (strain NBRC 102666 / KCTC 22515 / FYK2301M01) TaxID=1142394 RepID=I0IBV6_PHYMF|nr:hypothetical protein [Phycisphaera mikurensis]MBB6442030.1 hypothetical protein [Phycisphaera mikurensis]BAM02744.1 hypothetical protein PSMK_05850 [Phycisphaera mikurensis NBRC 102666]
MPAAVPPPAVAAPRPPAERAQPDTSDPAAAWAAVVAALEAHNAWAWLDQVALASGGDDAGVLCLRIRPRPAAAGVSRLATPDRLDRLAAQATAVLGRRTRITLVAHERPAASPGPGPGAAHAAAGALGSRVAAEAAEANAQRQEAMGRPLVRAVLSVFPDAVLVRAEKKKRRPGAQAEPEATDA